MENTIEQLQRIGIKIFFADPVPADPRSLVPVFHRWIQTHAIDQLLIDVADYDHLPTGPRVILVAHEGNFVIDNDRGRLGLQYLRKQPVDGPLAERISSLCATLLRAATLLEEDSSLSGALRFRGEELEVVANDRLLAPNSDAASKALQAGLQPLLTQLYPEGLSTISRHPLAAANPTAF